MSNITSMRKHTAPLKVGMIDHPDFITRVVFFRNNYQEIRR